MGNLCSLEAASHALAVWSQLSAGTGATTIEELLGTHEIYAGRASDTDPWETVGFTSRQAHIQTVPEGVYLYAVEAYDQLGRQSEKAVAEINTEDASARPGSVLRRRITRGRQNRGRP